MSDVLENPVLLEKRASTFLTEASTLVSSPSIDDDNLSQFDDKPFSSCPCPPSFHEGSIAGSSVNICTATLGAGILSLPYAFSLSGILLGSILLLIAAMATSQSVAMLVHACHVYGHGSTYEELTLGLYGRAMGVAVELSLLIFCLGTCIAYIIAVGDILEQGVLKALNVPLSREFVMVMFWGVVMVPLSLNERINSLRYASLLGVCSIFFLVVTTVVHSVRHWDLSQDADDGGVTLITPSVKDILRACPIIMFAFSCQVNVPAIYSELEDRNERGMKWVTRNGVAICLLAYSMMGVFGYLNFGDKTSDDILKNYCVDENPDVMIIASFLCITFSITMAFPMNVLPSRNTLDLMIRRWQGETFRLPTVDSEAETDTEMDSTDEHEYNSSDLNEPLLSVPTLSSMSTRRRVYLTLFICIFSLIIALVLPNVSIVFGLMGGTASSLLGFVMPALFYLKTEKGKGSLAAWALIIGGVLIGVLSTAVTIYGIIEGTDSPTTC